MICRQAGSPATYREIVPTKDVLTKADLAELRRSALGTANPLGVAADLAEAAQQGRLEDPDDAGDALTLAAEIAEIRARPDAALRYAEQALAAYPSEDDPRAGFARALRARALFRSGGRDDEAMAELTALRPLLSVQPDAPAYVSAALDAGGRSTTAETWLSEAVDTLLGERAAAGARRAGHHRDRPRGGARPAGRARCPLLPAATTASGTPQSQSAARPAGRSGGPAGKSSSSAGPESAGAPGRICSSGHGPNSIACSPSTRRSPRCTGRTGTRTGADWRRSWYG